jgi:long-chain fatty acid transport protein
LGTAFSGTASVAADPSTVFFNPAGMARLEGRQYSVGGNAIAVVSGFDNDNSRAGDGTAFERPLPGEEDQTDNIGRVPNLYYVHPLNDEWTIGAGLNAPFGLASSYDEDWQGRYHATDSELQTVNANVTAAYAVDDRLSFGFGVSYQHADVTLDSEVDSFFACTQAGGTEPTCASRHGGPGNRSADSSASIEGNDGAFVADLSVHWEPSEGPKLGLTWRQGASYELEGEASFDQSASCAQDPRCSGALSAQEGDVEGEAELPDTLTLSVSHDLASPWKFHGDLAWTNWSVLDEIEIVNESNGRTVSTLELEYEDTFRVAAGATYAPEGNWTWRFGTAFDQAPQKDPQLVTPRIPDQDRLWASFGANYRVSANSSLDFGYAHLFVEDVEINSVEQGNRLRGEFDASVDIFGVQYTGRF